MCRSSSWHDYTRLALLLAERARSPHKMFLFPHWFMQDEIWASRSYTHLLVSLIWRLISSASQGFPSIFRQRIFSSHEKRARVIWHGSDSLATAQRMQKDKDFESGGAFFRTCYILGKRNTCGDQLSSQICVYVTLQMNDLYMIRDDWVMESLVPIYDARL